MKQLKVASDLSGSTGPAMSVAGRKAKIRRTNVLVEHICINSEKSYGEVKAALDKLPRFDDRIREHLRLGQFESVKKELQKSQGDAGLVIFSVVTHGDWLQIVSRKYNAVQYVIGNVLVSTQMTRHELAAGLYAPLRIMLFENNKGTATLEYDQPSTLFGQYGHDSVTAVSKNLDRSIYDALIKAAE